MNMLKSARALTLSLLAMPLLLAGCSADFGNSTAPGGFQGATFHGTAMGGQQPITGAKIRLYAAGSTVNGFGGYTPGYGSAATSLIVSGANDYVLTDSNGNFTITGTYTCPQQNSQVYLVSTGGNPGLGAGTDNSAAVLVDALGSCGSLTSSTFVMMNELTTVAAVFALQQFINTNYATIGTSSANTQGLINAFTVAKQLVVNATGAPQQDTTLVKYPSAKIFTIGNALAGCVNSSGPSSTACTNLFAAAYNPNNPGAQASDTFGAALLIARYPSTNPTGIINTIPGVSAFGNSLTSANDLSLAITYSGNGIAAATAVAIDSTGAAFVNSCGQGCDGFNPYHDALIKIDPYNGTLSSGYITSGSSGFGSTTLVVPQAIALNLSNYVFITNGNSKLSAFLPNGTELPGSPYTNANFSTPEGIAVDRTNRSWVANSGSSSVTGITLVGGITGPLTNPNLQVPLGIALQFNQPYNNVVTTDYAGGGVAIFQGGSGGTYSTSTYAHAGATHPGPVALDASQNIWEVDSSLSASSDAKVFKLSSTGGTPYTASSGVAISGTGTIRGLAIDGFSNVILPSCARANCASTGTGTDGIFFLDNTGATVLGKNNLQDAHLDNPTAVAVDISGNAWVTNAGGTALGSVTEFVGVAGPVQTPISSAVASQTTGSRP